MSSDDSESQGPGGWRNWRLADEKAEWRARFEYGLYSDSAFVGELADVGPFTVLNTVGQERPPAPGKVRQVLTLRHESYIRHDTPRLRGDGQRTETGSYHGGWIDEEFAALISLSLGVRCRSGGLIRAWWTPDDVLGRPDMSSHVAPSISQPQRTILPGIAREGIALSDSRALFEGYPGLDRSQAIAVVRASRQYQMAIWSVDDDPNLSWLQLVGALEAAASTQRDAGSSLEAIEELWPELAELLKQRDLSNAKGVIHDLARLVRAAQKVCRLVERYKPTPLSVRPDEYKQVDWSQLIKAVKGVYKLRSQALHEGVPMPAPLLQPPMPSGKCWAERPAGAHGSWDSVWVDEQMPMHFHTFAHIVREVLCAWWKDLIPLDDASSTTAG